jgi:ABC-type antimicrobial peptide transport system permease subunit
VVSNVLYGNPISRDRSADALYIPLQQSGAADANVSFRHRGDEAAAQSAFQRTIQLIDPQVVPPTVATFDEMLSKTSLIASSTAKLFGSCFLFALLLAVSGTYGLMARWIGQRTREIGVRRALGASDAAVTRLLLGQGGRQLGVGVLIAIPVMVAVGFGFWRFVPIGAAVSAVAGVLVCGTIISVVLLASYLPTRRVLKVALRDALWRD